MKVLSSTRHSTGSMLESPLVFFISLFFMLVPFINSVALGIACVNIYLTACQASQKAAIQANFQQALTTADEAVCSLNSSGLLTIINMHPVGGFQNHGTNLYIVATNSHIKDKTEICGPNLPLNKPIDTNDWIYEYMAQSTYEVQPLIPVARIPYLKTIPGIGAPIRITFSSCRAAEFPEGLFSNDSSRLFSGGTSSINLGLNGLEKPGALTDLSNSGWNFPNIYQTIHDSGQTVIAEQVILVDSKNWNWTDTKLNVANDMKCWIDYRADGNWTYGPSVKYDADGDKNSYLGFLNSLGFPWASVIGKIGTAHPVLLGKNKFNFPIHGDGPFSLAMNDGNIGPGTPSESWLDNSGIMAVRIIITK